jgi:alpha-amylase
MKSLSKALLFGFSFSLFIFMMSAQVSANTFVHLFEWTWDDIAKECEFLGETGYSAVQISPPNEHRMLLGRPWYERYQPVSYKLTSRSGDRQDLIDMINACHAEGVEVYADAVINHMASCRPDCDQDQPQYGNQGVAGSTYNLGWYQFHNLFDTTDQGRVSGSLNSYLWDHFHHGCDGVSDWNDPWQVQNCELERLADLATERDDVQNTIANYLASLWAIGIDGLRIDAAKHMPAAELNDILWKAAQAANVRIEGTNINPGGAKSVLVFQEFIGNPPDAAGAYSNGKVTEFNFGVAEAKAMMWWDGINPSNAGDLIGWWNMQNSYYVVNFIDNHDNQRGHGGGGAVFAHKGGDGLNYGIRNDHAAYKLANIFMLAYPYGYPKVMSSYRFGNGELWDDQHWEQDIWSVSGMAVNDDFLGPPHDGNHKGSLAASDYADAANWTTRNVWNGTTNTCFDSGSKWMCEHRWRQISGMVGFRKATSSAWMVSNWWDDNYGQLAFGRGNKGFVVINGAQHTNPNALGPEGNSWFQTGMPAGNYCDVIHSTRSSNGSSCVGDNSATIAPITVYSDGKANFPAGNIDAMAIHVDSKLN